MNRGPALAFAIAIAATSTLACNRSKAPPPASDAPDGSAAAPVEASAPALIGTVDAGPAPEPPPIEAGPAPAGDEAATREARALAVLDLLSGGEPATRLPHDVADPGKAFDSAHRNRVAPLFAPATVRMAASITVTGSLPAEVIQRVARRNFGRFRLCYDEGLRRKPKLGGKIVIELVIDEKGRVPSSTSRGSDLPDAKMVECVRVGFLGLRFPSPESGVVRVTYPMLFSPGA